MQHDIGLSRVYYFDPSDDRSIKVLLTLGCQFYSEYNSCGVCEIHFDVRNLSARKFVLTKPNQTLSYNLVSLHLIFYLFQNHSHS